MRQPGKIHAANLASSPRLQRFLTALHAAKAPMSTRTLQIVAHVCNPNSCAAELRTQGYDIVVERKGDIFFYSLRRPEVVTKNQGKAQRAAEKQPALF